MNVKINAIGTISTSAIVRYTDYLTTGTIDTPPTCLHFKSDRYIKDNHLEFYEFQILSGGVGFNVTLIDGLLVSIKNTRKNVRGNCHIIYTKDGISNEVFLDSYGNPKVVKGLVPLLNAYKNTIEKIVDSGETVTSEFVESCIYRAMATVGKCCICGETLTDSLSVTRGIGPICWKNIYVDGNRIISERQQKIIDEFISK